MLKPKAYIIRNSETGEQWIAQSGKKVWSKAGHAKCAYASSYHWHARHSGMPTVQEVNSWTGKPQTRILKFNEQTKFVIEELYGEDDEAIALLKRCLGPSGKLDQDLYQDIKAFLESI